MPVRVRLEIRSRDGSRRVLETALINTGFTTNSPDLALPIAIAERLGLWPAPREAISVSIETGGGVVESYIVPQAVVVRVVTEDRVGREVVANALVNPFIDEILVSDFLAEELGIQIMFPRRGIWKFVDEDRLRESAV